jgi:hypothetical protein
MAYRPAAFSEAKMCSDVLIARTQSVSPLVHQALTNKKLRAKNARLYNPFSLFSGKSVNAVELLGQEFYEPSERGSVVGISGYSGVRASFNRESADYLTGKPFADGKNIFQYDVSSIDEFFKVLLQAYRTSGPIHKLALMGHGLSGGFAVGQDVMSIHFVREYRAYLSSLPTDLFAKDAEIVLLSCSAAQGTVLSPEKGVNSLRQIFGSFVKQGGTLIASRQIVLANLKGFRGSEVEASASIQIDKMNSQPLMESLYMSAVSLAVLPFIYANNIIGFFSMDAKSKYDPIEVIEIPVFEPSDQ